MRTRISRGLAAALAVSALSLTAACGGGSADDGKKKDGADKPSAGATTSAAPTSAAPSGPLTAAQMKAGVLELKDLPSGWKTTKRQTGSAVYKAEKAECQPIAALMNGEMDGATKGPTADFALGNNASEISEDVVTFPGTGAADFTKKLTTALDSCPDFAVTADGAKMKFTVKKTTAPQGAEEAHAFEIGMEVAPGIVIKPNLVFVRQGTGVLRFLYLADAAGMKEYGSLTKLATDKFVKAAQG
ncbi:hypothetical protein ACFY7C_11110 [Streptomyces sp. NPDC012769]|uniref:hypothetical protein n=1 Tax=Streptomyces sp. NPDC012769 TaxID=3364848 RepID=UPI0036CA4631